VPGASWVLHVGAALRTVRFLTFPNYLTLHMRKYVVDTTSWTPRKLGQASTESPGGCNGAGAGEGFRLPSSVERAPTISPHSLPAVMFLHCSVRFSCCMSFRIGFPALLWPRQTLSWTSLSPWTSPSCVPRTGPPAGEVPLPDSEAETPSTLGGGSTGPAGENSLLLRPLQQGRLPVLCHSIVPAWLRVPQLSCRHICPRATLDRDGWVRAPPLLLWGCFWMQRWSLTPQLCQRWRPWASPGGSARGAVATANAGPEGAATWILTDGAAGQKDPPGQRAR